MRDVFICNKKNSETQWKLLSATFSPSEALIQALRDKKGYFNHQKLTIMAKATNGLRFKSLNVGKQGNMEPSLNIERSNTWVKCGNPITKGHLNACPAKNIICKNCKYKSYFANLCKSKNKRPSINIVNDYVNSEICKYVRSEDSWSKNQKA